ncbi:hypothetical protein ACG9VW_004580 [Vibrio parahaemolyticus]
MTRENRNKTIKIRVTSSEFDLIDNHKGNLSMSDFMRKSALKSGKIKSKKTSMADPKLLTEIARVGNLLNQITRVVNTHAKAGYPLEAARVSIHIKSIEGLLRETLKNAS